MNVQVMGPAVFTVFNKLTDTSTDTFTDAFTDTFTDTFTETFKLLTRAEAITP